MNFEFATATRIIFGPGKLSELPQIARGLGGRALLVTGSRSASAQRLTELFESGGVASERFVVAGEPTVPLVNQGVAQAQESKCQFIIAMGGGSVIDAGKAIAAMLANDGELLDYVEVVGRGKTLSKPSLPFIAIPTTAGTGAEVTRNAVLGSIEHRVKASLRSPFMLPTVALLDPELTYDLPPALTASTGLDALTQLIEPFTCNRANALTDTICREGMRRVARSLRIAYAEGRNVAAREDMMLAGLFGGLALANAGLGAAHGFAAPIGGMFPAPHGAVCAALLPQVMIANVRAARAQGAVAVVNRCDEVARILTGDQTAQAAEGMLWVSELVRDLNIPPLRAYGINASHVAELVAKAAQASSMKANPIPLSPEELSDLLNQAL
jgi:alcohol dehydrogenase class IV